MVPKELLVGYLIFKMTAIKLTVSPKLKQTIDSNAKELGIKTTEYIMSIVIGELRKQELAK